MGGWRYCKTFNAILRYFETLIYMFGLKKWRKSCVVSCLLLSICNNCVQYIIAFEVLGEKWAHKYMIANPTASYCNALKFQNNFQSQTWNPHKVYWLNWLTETITSRSNISYSNPLVNRISVMNNCFWFRDIFKTLTLIDRSIIKYLIE